MAYTFKHGDQPLDGYTIQRAIGRGGFGEVYYAVADSGKQVALKYLRENPEVELRGIAHVMNLKSPHLITIYDVRKTAAGEPFVIMEYVSGPSLRDLLIAEPGGMPAHKAAFLLAGIAKGLSYLHERGIVHRDLKPGNIFYDDGYVKIGDYGLSKHISVSRHSGQTVSVGTVHYMAPEIGSGSYTKAIDIYALGVILYEMLTGRLPFTGSSMAEVLMRHLRDQPDLAGVPAPFARVIAKALEKDPADRYQDADEMLADMMDSAELSAEVASFDASGLTQVPRAPAEYDPERTVTSPAGRPPPPPLDVHEASPFDAGQPLPGRLHKRFERLSRKLDEKAAALERRFGPAQLRGQRPHRWAEQDATAPPCIRRGAQTIVLLAVTAAIAVAMSFPMGGNEERIAARAVSLFIVMFAGTMGPLLAHLWLLQRMITRNTVFDRLAYTSMAGLFMLPVLGIADEIHEHDLGRMLLGPVAALLLCDWSMRIAGGRRGDTNVWHAFWPAVFGFFAALAVDADDHAFLAAGVCAAMSLLTEAAAAMWPLGRSRSMLPGPGGPPPRAAAPPPVTPPPPPPQDPPRAERTAEPAHGTAEAVGMQAGQPSFVGRAAHAGMSFLGKLLLLSGLVLAIGVGSMQARTTRVPRQVFGVGEVYGPGGHLTHTLVTEHVQPPIPPGVIFIPLAAGSVFMVLARRRTGFAHFLRGVFGTALVLLGGLMAMTVASQSVGILLTGRNTALLAQDEYWGPLFGNLFILGLGILLLLWPRRKHERTIVI